MADDMNRDTRDRVIAIEQKMAQLYDTLEKMGGKLDAVLDRSIKRDKEVGAIKAQVQNMAPSVDVIKDGLIFWRVSRWIIGIVVVVTPIVWGVAGSFDQIKAALRAFAGYSNKVP